MTDRDAPNRTGFVLAALFTGAFVMGCAEMLVVGMLDLIAADLSISVSAAGALVTANALGLAIGGPLLTLVTIRSDRRRVLVAAVTVFALLNLLPALGAGYPLFVAARVIIGAVQGVFIAAALTMATSIVTPERAGRAMAVVISGFATSSAVGLPLGTLLGQAVGWRGSFSAVVALAVVVAIVAVVVLPAAPTTNSDHRLGQARFAFAPSVLAVLGVGLLMFAGIQAALTYVVPYLEDVAGISGPVVSAFLLAYGVATAVGSAAGGRFADGNAARALIVGTLGVTASLAAMVVFGRSPWLMIVSILGIGLFGMGIAPSIQHRVVTLAGPGASLASSLPASAVNAGIALGSAAGGLAIPHGGVSIAVVTGAVIAATSVVAAYATRTLRPGAVPATTASATVPWSESTREEASS